MTAVERLAEIEARAEGLPAGPWRVESDDADSGHDVWSDRGDWTKDISLANVDNADFTGDGDDQRIAAFIAAARTDVPALVAALRAVLALHTPKAPASAWDMVGWTTCSCGAMEVTRRIDGDPSLAPAEYPCPTVTAIAAALDAS